MRHLFDNTKVLASLVPATRTADANGTGVDTQGYENAMLVVAAGDIDLADADETYVIELEESDDNSTWSDVSGHDVTITADNEVDMVRISGLNITRKRYLRAVLNVSGTSPSFPGTAIFLLGGGDSGAVNSD
jgi:ABC-type phosphate/phosphonate transport system substrate-binding protein